MANSKFVRLYYEHATEVNGTIFCRIKLLIENDENLLSYIYESFNNFIDVCTSEIYPIVIFSTRCGSIIRKCVYELYENGSNITLGEMLSIDYDHLLLTLFDEWCENNEVNLNELLF